MGILQCFELELEQRPQIIVDVFGIGKFFAASLNTHPFVRCEPQLK